ncbi:pyrroline-5-carboxylate reductase family protein [Oryzifoliimicrobium ureilyticus]|uniref:pyrroline-5-carboxylate reductase family protein n=1 Tax=Oryzifoliimicrobium ureilyticus TaxID=3113724 RepID=UPI0030764C57
MVDGVLRIGVIGGAGWLGKALTSAVISAGVVSPTHVSLSYRRQRADGFDGCFWTQDNQELADRSDVILLSVRPQDWHAIKVDMKGKLVISVMAGISLDTLSKQHKTDRVVRALPNAAAEIGLSYTPWIASHAVNKADRFVVRSIFKACGHEDEVESDRQIDYLTGLSGSGPAFPALLASAMMQHAKAFGLSDEVARRAVVNLLKGTGRLFERHDYSPDEVVKTFVDYDGTTAAGIITMRDAYFHDAVASGLTAAFEKSVRMGDAS